MRRRWTVLWLLIFFSACGGGGGGGGGDSAPPGIQVAPAQSNLTPGQRLQLTANAEGVVWISKNPDVATIDANGQVTGHRLGVARIIAQFAGLRGVAVVGVVSPNPGAAALALSGVAHYEDLPFDEAGFTGAIALLPIRHAVVQLIGIDGFETLATTATDPLGAFSFSGIDHTRRRGGVYLRMRADTQKGHKPAVEIRNNPEDHAIYALTATPQDDSLGTTFLSDFTARATRIGGVFNLFDQFLSAGEFVEGRAACPSTAGRCIIPGLVAYWEARGGPGTHFKPDSKAIFICGSQGGGNCVSGDGDEYDDAVVLHEYGHFILNHFSHDDSPGGIHLLGDHTQDIRLAWSEGWATFFSSAVRNRPLYVDTGANLLSYEIEHLTSLNMPTLASDAIYTTNEGAVAAVLWDAFDAPVVEDDGLALGFAPLWTAVSSIASPTTIESFQRRFAALHLGIDTYADDLQSLLQSRRMELFPDSAEGSGEVSLRLNGAEQAHTLYTASGVDDTDKVPFDVTRNGDYVLRTVHLKNGADTALAILDANGNILFENDNRNGQNNAGCTTFCPPNNGTALASEITFRWTVGDTTLHAKVKRSSNAPPSAGRYGSYTLQLRHP